MLCCEVVLFCLVLFMFVCSYFMRAGDSVVTVQQGVFRTNCIDCLDRTNVVQSMLAKKSLHEQLQVRRVGLEGDCEGGWGWSGLKRWWWLEWTTRRVGLEWAARGWGLSRLHGGLG